MRSSFISWKMAGFDTNLNYGTFDPDMDPTSVGLRFRKYVERFKVYALAMSIKDKARKRALFLHCAGPIASRETFMSLLEDVS